MGRPEMLTDDQKSLITRLKDEHPGFKAKDVIKEVKAYLIAEAKKELPTRDIKEIEKLVED